MNAFSCIKMEHKYGYKIKCKTMRRTVLILAFLSLGNLLFSQEEKAQILAPIVTDFASVFSLPAERCLEGSFTAIEADASKSYSQLYAAV